MIQLRLETLQIYHIDLNYWLIHLYQLKCPLLLVTGKTTLKMAWRMRRIVFCVVAQMVKNLPAMRDTWVWSLDWKDPLEEGMVTHSSILAWRIPWTEEPGRVQFKGFTKVGHNWETKHSTEQSRGSGIQVWWFTFLQSSWLCPLPKGGYSQAILGNFQPL